MTVPRLVDDVELGRSDVVANSLMNRERHLEGVNSYTKELGLNPLEELVARASRRRDDAAAAWLDVCCGTGLALLEAADAVKDGDVDLMFVGIDLVDHFVRDAAGEAQDGVELICAPVLDWSPHRSFDLITSVHGLHYVGDKLAALGRMAGWLEPDGVLAANLDLTSIRLDDGRPAGRTLTSHLRRVGFELDQRSHRIVLRGRRSLELPYCYLGADDAAGPNYTGQPAVHSYYRVD